MPNMSYCRFQNTFSDLGDCEQTLYYLVDLDELSKEELDAAVRLVELCRSIAEEYPNGLKEAKE